MKRSERDNLRDGGADLIRGEKHSFSTKLMAAACIGWAAGGTAAYIGQDSLEREVQRPRPTVTVTVASEFTTPSVPDVYVLRMVDTDSTEPSIYGEDKLRKGFSVFDQAIRSQTNEKYGVSLRAIDTVHPIATNGSNGKKCYDGEAVKNTERAYRRANDLGSRAVIALVAENTPLCSSSGAYATQSDGRSMLVFQRGMTAYIPDKGSEIQSSKTQKDNALSASLIAHEFGHLWRLGHATEIKCARQKNGLTAKDINQLATCEPLSLTKTNKYAYGQYDTEQTSMGMRPSHLLPGGTYALPELAKLDPKNFLIQKVDNFQPAEYELSTEANHPKGIRIDLPNDHPLKNIDPTITQLVIGFDTAPRVYSDTPVGNPHINRDKYLDVATYAVSTNKGNDVATYLIETSDISNFPNKSSVDTLRTWMSERNLTSEAALPIDIKAWYEQIIYLDTKNDAAITIRRDVVSDKFILKLTTAADVKPSFDYMQAESKRQTIKQ